MLRDDLRKDFDALVPSAGASRRAALQLMLGAGYAAAAAPVMAQTAIKTPSDGLTVGEIDYTVGGFKVPAYRAAPAGKTGLPVVLVIQEIFGVHEYIADVCRRFARARATWRSRLSCMRARAIRVPMARWPSLWLRWSPRCPMPRCSPTWTVPCNGPVPMAAT